MPFQISPGVIFTENDYTGIVPGLSTFVGGFAGAFSWGPVEEIVTVNSEKNLVDRFGKPNDDQFKYWFQAAGFLSYSNNLKIVRVAGANARNAASGGKGSGCTLTVTVTSGQITGASVGTAGTGYVPGDILIVTSAVDDARFRVLTTTGNGAVGSIALITGGAGHTAGSKTTEVVDNVLVKNDADLADDVVYPEVIAKYPGVLGNSMTFSAVRASEFDQWAYRNRFVVPPAASVWKWSGNGSTSSFALPGGATALPAGAIVTVDGAPRVAGVDPGKYGVSGGNIVFVEEIETFTANGSTNAYTLINEFGLDTSEARLTVAGVHRTRYTGTATEVPFGYFKINGNAVTIGVKRAAFDGNGSTLAFNIPNVTGINDARVFVNGIARTVIYTGTVASGQVRFSESGGGTVLTFFAGEAPSLGASNVVVNWDYPDAAQSIEITYGAPKAGANNVKVFYDQTEIHAVVVDKDGEWTGEKNALLERFEFLSLSPTAKFPDGRSAYYVSAINRRSQYVRVPGPLVIFGSKELSGGVDANVPGSDITPGLLQTGYAMFQNGMEIEVDHVIGGDADVSTAVYIISNILEQRRDLVGYFSPPMDAAVENKGNEARDIVAHRLELGSTSYAHMSSGWAYRYDRYNDKFRWVPLAGDDAGIYALTHETVDPWWSGAGFNRGRYRNVVKLSFVPSQTDMDELYANNVNPSAWFKGEGPVLYGDKTMQTKASAFDRMNVRWLFIVLQRAITRAAKYYLFEFNDPFTRNQFKNMVHPFLRNVQGRRGIQDFKIVCDDTNNTGVVIDRNEFIGDIYIKPARSINFIQLNFNAVGTAVNFDEIINANAR